MTENNFRLKRRKSVLPAIYNSNLTRYDWYAQEPPEESCNQTVHVKLEREVDNFRQEYFSDKTLIIW